MEISTIELRLSGDMRNTVVKIGVTPAEILVLRAIHGQGSVFNVQPGDTDKRPHADELERLRSIYAPRFQDEGKKDIVGQMFPGIAPQLPVKLKDIQIADEDFHRDVTLPARRSKAAKKAKPDVVDLTPPPCAPGT